MTTKLGSFNNEVDVVMALQLYFNNYEGKIKRAVGGDIINHQLFRLDDPRFKQLLELYPEIATGENGLNFPIDKTAPFGSYLGAFYDEVYHQVGWNWQEEGHNIPNHFKTMEEAIAKKNSVTPKETTSTTSTSTTTTSTTKSPIKDTTIPQRTKYQKESAELNKWYESDIALPKFLLCTHGDHPENYYYCIKKDGVIIYENFSQRPKLPSDRQHDYMGDHPLESQIPVKTGMYEIYVKNLKPNAIIFGQISKDQYIQYNKNGLNYADQWVKLEEGQEASWNFEVKLEYDSNQIRKSWNNIDNAFFCTRPLFENGVLYIEETRLDAWDAAMVKYEGKSHVRFYGAVEPHKNLTIETETSGANNKAKYRVIEKNGLDLDPNMFLVSCFQANYYKFFCHDANTFPDNPQ